MSSTVIGLLPMGGQGLRLGMPFPKPLAPIITDDGIVPLYRFALDEVRAVTHRIHAIVSPRVDTCLSSALRNDLVEPMMTREPNLPAALGDAGDRLGRIYGKDALLVVALPDSIWTKDSTRTLANVLANVRDDGALALFSAKANELDEVSVSGERVVSVTTKSEDDLRSIIGWGAFIVRAGALATFTDREKDGPQLGRLRMGWQFLGSYVDLGTPDRYIKWHDMRRA